MKRAFITGITGQDGSYLAELLLEKGYEVHGLVRRTSTFENWKRIEHLKGKITTHYGDMTDPFSLLHALKKIRPDEIYNLAAQSHVQVSWETPWYTAQTTGIGVLNLLEAVRVLDMEKTVRIYQASTSELFSGNEGYELHENTPKDPASPYGTAKLYGYQISKNYREAFGMFICNGILFNHESERRGDNFVTKKIINAVLAGEDEVRLGNTEAKRDWGYAPEYMEAAWRMLQHDKPDDYVVATGVSFSVEQFVEWTREESKKPLSIVHDSKYMRPVDVQMLKGSPKKIETILGWKAQTYGRKLIRKMLGL